MGNADWVCDRGMMLSAGEMRGDGALGAPWANGGFGETPKGMPTEEGLIPNPTLEKGKRGT